MSLINVCLNAGIEGESDRMFQARLTEGKKSLSNYVDLAGIV